MSTNYGIVNGLQRPGSSSVIWPTFDPGNKRSIGGFSNLGVFTNAATTTQLTAVGRRQFAPLYIPAGEYNRVGINVTAAQASTWRLGLHAMGVNGWPEPRPLYDFGTVDCSGSAGRRDNTILIRLTGGWYWSHVQVDAYTATPTVTAVQGQGSHGWLPLGFLTDVNNPTRSRAAIYDSYGSSGSLSEAPQEFDPGIAKLVSTTNEAVRFWVYRV